MSTPAQENKWDECATLLVKPSGKLSSHYSLTVGATYPVLGRMGCCVVIGTNEKGETASINESQVVFCAKPALSL